MKSKPDFAALNENYHEDFNLSIRLLSWILKSIGAWPNRRNANLRTRVPIVMTMIMSWFIISATTIPCFLFHFIELDDSYQMLMSFAALNYLIAGAIKYFILLVNKSLLQRCTEHLKMDWKNVNISEDRQTMLEKTHSGKKIVNTCVAFMYSSVIFFYCVIPITNGKEFSEDGNITFRPMIYGFAKMIVDPRPSPYNEIIISIHCACGYIITATTASACSLAAVFVLHACGQLEVLVSLLHRIVDERDESSAVDDRITLVVEHHVRALKFIEDIDQLLRYVSLVEIAENTINMCILGYYVIIDWNSGQRANSLSYVSLITSLSFNIFIFCYIGELLNAQYDRVFEMTYMINWHRIPGKKGLGLVLIMAMSNASKKMTAGNLFNLSLTRFGDIMKTSVGFLNLLRTTTI